MSLSEEDQAKIDEIKKRAAQASRTRERKAARDPDSEKAAKNELSPSEVRNILGILILLGLLIFIFGDDIKGWLSPILSPDYRLTAAELYRAYDQDEVAAKIKYKGKLVELRGKYIGSGVSGGTSYALLDVPGNAVFTVQCFFPESKEAQIPKLRKGEQVVLKGVVSHKFGNVFLNDCAVIRGQ